MIERLVYTALTRGLSAYATNSDTLYTELFGGIYQLDPAEIEDIRKYFLRLPPKVYIGYPRAALDEHPSYFIFLAGEQQPDFALNDFGGSGAAVGPALPGGGYQAIPGASVLSSIWTHNYTVLCLAQGGPEPCLWMYEVAKSVFLAAKLYFIRNAIQLVTLAGSDVAPQEPYAPAQLYGRSLTFRCQREFSQADTAEGLQRAFRVDGLTMPTPQPDPSGPISRIEILPRSQ